MGDKSSISPGSGKPSKPTPDFPLYAHASGRWAKKIGGKLCFFGRWGHKRGSQIVPVADVNASAYAALEELGRRPDGSPSQASTEASTAGGECTIADLCNRFLSQKKNLVDSRELSPHSFSEYLRTCETIVKHFGRNRAVASLTPADFSGFRAALAKGCSVVTILSKVNRCRVVFKFASDSELIDRPVRFGESFNRPKPKDIRAAKNSADPRTFTRDELLMILAAADGKPVDVDGESVMWPGCPVMRSMILLGLNCGFGNTDVSSLPIKAVDLSTGWITYPRPKTEVQRRIPLWAETSAALAVALAQRPKAKNPADDGLCFLTDRGTRFVRIQESRTTEGHSVTINGVARRFENLLRALKLDGNKGRNFYSLRHQFETIAGESADQVAVDAIMGHVDPSMGANYRHGVSDERLRKVVNTVRQWLWPDSATPEAKRSGGKPRAT